MNPLVESLLLCLFRNESLKATSNQSFLTLCVANLRHPLKHKKIGKGVHTKATFWQHMSKLGDAGGAHVAPSHLSLSRGVGWLGGWLAGGSTPRVQPPRGFAAAADPDSGARGGATPVT